MSDFGRGLQGGVRRGDVLRVYVVGLGGAALAVWVEEEDLRGGEGSQRRAGVGTPGGSERPRLRWRIGRQPWPTCERPSHSPTRGRPR